MQREKGHRCPGSGYGSGFPHGGKHKKEERVKRLNERLEENAIALEKLKGGGR